MENNLQNHLTLFKTTFCLSAFTFGGGYTIIPLMHKRFVEEYHWLEEEDMLNIAAMAQSAPGAIVVNASILVGWRLLGFTGAICAILGTILPPMVILSIISFFYSFFQGNAVVSAVLKGMMAGVCAVIFDMVFTMGKKVLKSKKWLPCLIMLCSFIAFFVLNINIVYIILFCGMLGALVAMRDEKTGKEHL